MTTTMKLAIETYATLTNRTFEAVVNECLNGNAVICLLYTSPSPRD